MSVTKGDWYTFLMKKAERAIRNQFYFEAVFIEYMIIDD